MAFNKTKALEEAARLVSQRKLPEAIKRYLAIAEKDPEDLSLLNTTGDLCVRAGNVPEALRQFNRLAAAYSREGFTLKAIAIYKKIAKLDTQSVDSFLKLAELYTSQGLSHEAREQYAQALAFCQTHGLQEKTSQILTKLVALDPSNPAYRMRLAEFHETSGRREEALEGYLEAAALADRHKNASLAGTALAKARGINPRHMKILLLELRRAAEGGRVDEARRIYASAPEMKSNHEAKLILLTALLANGKLTEALNVAIETYRDHPSGFEPLDRFIHHCLDAGDPDAALEPLRSIADLALKRDAEKLISSLGQIATKRPRHTANLDWMEAICMRATSAAGWAETFEAIAKAYGESGEWEKARRVYSKLLETNEQHPQWRSLLNQALEKQGKIEPAASEARPGSETGSRETAKTELPIESTGAPEHVRAPLSPELAIEMDFSKEWQGFTSPQAVPAPPPAPAAADLGEEKREVQFYLDYGLFAEARVALEALEKKYPAHPELIELRKHMEETPQPSRSEAEAEPVSPDTLAEAPDVEMEDNSQTHYHLGLAFREMGLLDEAIGEFQKVVKRAGKGNFPPHFVESCSLLGLCFLEKGEPRIAAQWYLRAREAPDADEETSMALSYGLASAYEQLGDSKAALEKFAEVYSLNIDYRDVAERVRALRQRQPES